ncbi:MAG TPA: hypothetical protein VIE15_00025 [Acidimicrobiales bacterium]
MTGRTIYEDSRMTLSSVAITFRGYWAPFGLSRTFRITEITGLDEHTRNDPAFDAWPRWGKRGKAVWFPLDWSRPRRDVAVALHRANGSTTVVTPANPQRLLALLGELGVPVETPPTVAD